MTETSTRLTEIRQRIEAATRLSGRQPGAVQFVAVAKTATPTTLHEAWQAGQRLFGHNRVQALEAHRLVLPRAQWHLLGPLQGKKVRRGLASADLFQALGELRTLQRCSRVLQETAKTPFPVLLQVNLHPQDGRYGCTLSEVDRLADQILATSELHFAGLMTLPPPTSSVSDLRLLFSTLQRRFQDLQSENRLTADALLSMGMSADFETAIEEGANLVRIGRAIFPPPATD